jgi:type VI protein secretion system component VasK
MKEIKIIITCIMFVTGSALVILAAFSALFDVKIHFVPTVFEIFAANILINLGLFLRWKFEIRYIILEYLVDITYTIVVLVVSGFIFNWYSAIPVWLLIVMAVVIYILAMTIIIIRVRKDTNELNDLLQKRKKKQADTACLPSVDERKEID